MGTAPAGSMSMDLDDAPVAIEAQTQPTGATYVHTRPPSSPFRARSAGADGGCSRPAD